MVGRAESTVMTLALVGIALTWWWNNYGQLELPSATAPASPGQIDFWTTPLYLRSNQPMAANTVYVLPVNPIDSYSLAVPTDQLGGTA